MEKTNREKAKELASIHARQYHHNTYPEFSTNNEFVFSNNEIEIACNEMAEWKDQQFAEEKKKWLDKACMWIEYKYIKNSGGHYSVYRKENIIKSFRKSMEE